MALTQYLTATTLDGFIADADNSLELAVRRSRARTAAAGFDAFLGERRRDGDGRDDLRVDPRPREPAGESPNAGRSSTPTGRAGSSATASSRPIPGADLRFVQGDVAPVHEEMVAAAGSRNVWLVGGGELVGQFHDAGLLDQVLVSIAPVTLGAGAPLLPRRIEGLRLSRGGAQRPDGRA